MKAVGFELILVTQIFFEPINLDPEGGHCPQLGLEFILVTQIFVLADLDER